VEQRLVLVVSPPGAWRLALAVLLLALAVLALAVLLLALAVLPLAVLPPRMLLVAWALRRWHHLWRLLLLLLHPRPVQVSAPPLDQALCRRA
jgi:hypothetical protein